MCISMNYYLLLFLAIHNSVVYVMPSTHFIQPLYMCMHGIANIGMRHDTENGSHGNEMRKNLYWSSQDAVLSSWLKHQWPQRTYFRAQWPEEVGGSNERIPSIRYTIFPPSWPILILTRGKVKFRP